MVDLFSFKELEQCYLKATYPIEIGNRKIEIGEVIAQFDKLQMTVAREQKDFITANGGFDNRAHVYWETTKEFPIRFSQGVFSAEQLALLSNSRLVEIPTSKKISLTKTELVETKEDGSFELSEEPIQLFLYNRATGEKIMNYEQHGKVIQTGTSFLDITARYLYNYESGARYIQVGRRLLQGFVELEARTRVKDDTTGQVVTGLLKIPKLKLMSDLSISLGANTPPTVANFTATGVPVGQRGTSYVSEFYILNSDLDSDF